MRALMTSKRVVLFLAASVIAAFFSFTATAAENGVKITQLKDRLRVEIDGKLFTEYRFANVPRPYFYPVNWIDGQTGLTRNWPMKDGVEGEEKDHIHHRGVWFAHRHVSGHDFWGETPKSGKIVHDKFLEIKSGKDVGTIRHTTRYIAKNGAEICADERVIRIHRRPDSRMLDFQVTLKASANDIVLEDDKDAGMGIRVAHTMKVTNRDKTAAGGHMVNSEGHRDGAAWGKAARWLDNHGMANGKRLGVAIFDHPDNPRYPTWWHARDYGLLTANAFGKRHFEKLKDTHAGDMPIRAGESRSWKYRFYWHKGDEKQGQVEKRWREFAAGK
ncbi:MAG: hypothetical protein ACI9VS_000218 [Candidatus Binatia bacterium]|jgi:hypothetical protein